jgi:hypothetical protein
VTHADAVNTPILTQIFINECWNNVTYYECQQRIVRQARLFRSKALVYDQLSARCVTHAKLCSARRIAKGIAKCYIPLHFVNRLSPNIQDGQITIDELDVPFPVPLPTLIRSQFQAKPATLLIPIDLFF